MFIARRNGVIYGAWTMPQPGAEEVKDNDSAYLEFVDRKTPELDRVEMLRAELIDANVLTRKDA